MPDITTPTPTQLHLPRDLAPRFAQITHNVIPGSTISFSQSRCVALRGCSARVSVAVFIIRFGGNLAKLIASAVTPLLCATYGWQYVCYVYGGALSLYTIAWNVFARNEPRPLPDKAASASSVSTAGETDVDHRGSITVKHANGLENWK